MPILILEVPSPADSDSPVILSAVAEGIVGRVPNAIPAGDATLLEPNWGDAEGERDRDRLNWDVLADVDGPPAPATLILAEVFPACGL